MDNAAKIPLSKGIKKKYSGEVAAYSWEQMWPCINALGNAGFALAIFFGSTTVPPLTLIMAMGTSLAIHNALFTCF